MASEGDIANALTRAAVDCLRYGMEKIEHCVAQLDDRQVWWRPDDRMNAIGNLLLHLAGNLEQGIIAGVGRAQARPSRPPRRPRLRAWL